MKSPVVSAAEMRAAEEAAFARGITAEALMDAAAMGIARTVGKFFPRAGRCLVFAGKGNNAGDAWTAATILHGWGWEIESHPAFGEEAGGELAQKKLRALQAALERGGNSSTGHSTTIVLDGLLGLGAKPPLREPIRSACREINALRQERNAFVFAIDLPTGLDGDSGEADPDTVVADCTVTIGFAKRGLVADHALDLVGRIETVPLAELAAPEESRACMADRVSLRGLLPRRKFNAYKNQFGRVGIVAGSRGLTGAAVLCATGALRGGAGLVELFVREEAYPVIATTVPPEVMVKPVDSYRDLLQEPVNVWAIGPGLGQIHRDEILRLIEDASQPMVIDADALNILSTEMAVLERAVGPRLLTPHPGEMKRLFPAGEDDLTRTELASRFVGQHPVTLLFKGSRSIVAENGQPPSYNSTGSPGMATGGMGDVLTGICAALIAQGLSPYNAARLGAWLSGRAAEIALFDKAASEQSLLPTDVLQNLGRAFRDLQA